jgi:crystallin alpha B
MKKKNLIFLQVKLEIQNFQPDEISVKAVDRYIMVEGKHEERGEKLGLISHQFTRRYVLPEGVLPENVTCSLGSNGILTLSAPRNIQDLPKKEVKIPIYKNDTEGGATIFDVTSPQKERSPKPSI